MTVLKNFLFPNREPTTADLQTCRRMLVEQYGKVKREEHKLKIARWLQDVDTRLALSRMSDGKKTAG